MNNIKQLHVSYHGRKVGTMALYQNRLAAFEYADEWLADGFSISPISLPLEKKVLLAIVGHSGMGALAYEPEIQLEEQRELLNP